MTTNEKFDALWNFLKTNGELLVPKHPRMDNWASDTWVYGQARASLTDGGYSRAITYGGVTAYQTASFPIQFVNCDSQYIDELYTIIFEK